MFNQTRARVPAGLLALGLMATATLSACSDSTATTSNAGGAKPVLTMAMNSAPTSMDPSKGSGGGNAVFQDVAYQGLLHITGAGTGLEPSLAESFEWVGDDNTELKVVLRDGLEFSDGTPLDSAAVKASIEHFTTAGSVFSYVALPIDKIETPDEGTVVFKLKMPTPSFPYYLAEGPGMGMIINPAALKDAEALGTSTAGAGPYELDEAETVQGSVYTYTPNPNYFDPAAVEYSKVVLKVIQDPNTALSSLESGQVDVSYGFPDTFERAEGRGLGAANFGIQIDGLWIQDHTGDVVPALGDVRVRQALNHAVDRAAISQAVTLGTGTPTAQLATEGSLGYDPALEEIYTGDVDQAKSLLAEAGYEDGFTIPVIVPSFIPTANAIAQALAAQFEQIGVTLKITTGSTFPEYAQQQESGKFAATVVPLDLSLGVPAAFDQILAPYALVNPRHENPEALMGAAGQAAATSGDEAATAWQGVGATIVEEAMTVPVTTESSIYYFGDTVDGVDESSSFNPVFFSPAE